MSLSCSASASAFFAAASGSLFGVAAGLSEPFVAEVVDGELSVRCGHDIAHLVKDRLLESPYQINDVIVHIEPGDASQLPG